MNCYNRTSEPPSDNHFMPCAAKTQAGSGGQNNSRGHKNKILQYSAAALLGLFPLVFPAYAEKKKEGCVQGDCSNGRGVFVFPDGTKYDGGWRKGVFTAKAD